MVDRDEIAFQKEVLDADERIRVAVIDSDLESMRAGATETFGYVHSGAARIDTRETWIEQVQSAPNLFVDRVYEGTKVSVLGDAALVTSFVIDKYNTQKYAGAPSFARYHQARIFHKVSGAWLVAYLHTTWAVNDAEQSHQMLGLLYKTNWSKLEEIA